MLAKSVANPHCSTEPPRCKGFTPERVLASTNHINQPITFDSRKNKNQIQTHPQEVQEPSEELHR